MFLNTIYTIYNYYLTVSMISDFGSLKGNRVCSTAAFTHTLVLLQEEEEKEEVERKGKWCYNKMQPPLFQITGLSLPGGGSRPLRRINTHRKDLFPRTNREGWSSELWGFFSPHPHFVFRSYPSPQPTRGAHHRPQKVPSRPKQGPPSTPNAF